MSLVILGFISFVSADSATQTDWSGGPDNFIPLPEFGDGFHCSFGLNWSESPGNLELDSSYITGHVIDEYFDGPSMIISQDINGDGYTDVISATSANDVVCWFQNSDTEPGIFWTQYICIDSYFDNVSSIYSEDIDGDGDFDVLGAAFLGNDIVWWSNDDGEGCSWTKHSVHLNFSGAICVKAGDINDDTHMDIIGAGYLNNKISWWENADSSGTSWIEHIVTSDFSSVNSIFIEDIDQDGDLDILGCAHNPGDICWWENSDGTGTVWVKHNIDVNFTSALYVAAVDFNGDDDIDVLCNSNYGVGWWENMDGIGTIWQKHVIDGSSVRHSCTMDVDSDGDLDVVGALFYSNILVWWENADSCGTSWLEHVIRDGLDGVCNVYSSDINSDASLDILCAVPNADSIMWWELNPFCGIGILESSILNTQTNPNWDCFDWSCQIPSGTSISFQVRASNDPWLMTGEWSDTLTAPCNLEGILIDGDSYFQYKAILQSSDSTLTPILEDLTISWNTLGLEGEEYAGFQLIPPSPNPVTGSAIVRFSVPVSTLVDLMVFDISGRLFSEIHGDEYSPGYHSVLVEDLCPGIYFCRMISGNFTETQRFVVIQ